MDLTKGQVTGAAKLGTWMKLKPTALSSRIFILTGKAGTGKTTLVKFVFKELLGSSKRFGPLTPFSFPPVMGVCMSHKAKHVLSGSIPECLTYAGYFGHTISYKQDGTTAFIKRKASPWSKFPHEIPIPFVIHDECSMYNEQMLKEVLNTTHPRTKIIFMGDPGQLPPVDADGYDIDSPIFGLNIGEASRHHLTERVRQTDENPIIPLSDIIYGETFGAQRFKPMYQFAATDQHNSAGEGFEKIFYSQLVDKFAEVSEENILDSKVIAYRKFQVANINSQIRQRLFGDVSARFVPGDVVVFNNTLVNDPQRGNEADYTFYNSDEYKIKAVREGKYLDIPVYVLDVHIPQGEGHHLERVKNPFFRVVHEKGLKAFSDECDRLHTIASAEKDKTERRKKFAEYHSYKAAFGDVSYAYALTCYKAQGSTYKHIFVDMNDIRTTGPLSKKRKLQSWYTAVTRASHNVYLIGQDA